jgi:hypothetical protein
MRLTRLIPALLLAVSAAFPQSRTLTQGPHRMEITLERLDGDRWQAIDPGLVLAQGDHVRFRYRTNFDGYLYVTNHNSSGAYQQLVPLAETGQDNRVTADHDYRVPSTATMFTIGGPAGFETVYWLVTPSRVSEPAPRTPPVPRQTRTAPDPNLTPRCDDTIWRARGDCIDNSAGPKLVPRGETLPESLASGGARSRDLFFMRQDDKAIISSPTPLTGPVLYEFRLAHR